MQVVTNDYNNLLLKIQNQIKQSQEAVFNALTRQKVVASWNIGKLINEHLSNNDESSYGKKIMKQLAEDLAIAENNIYKMRAFYKKYPTLPKDDVNLNWNHYQVLIGISDADKRKYLEGLAVQNGWSVRTLQQEVSDAKAKKAAASNLKTKKLIKNPGQKPSAKLRPIRGQLFTYPLLEIAGVDKVVIDCGFNIFRNENTLIKSGKAGTTIESVKNADDTYSFKESTGSGKALNIYKAYLERVVDGDTIRVILDLGFNIFHEEILRLKGINAPENDTVEGKKSSKVLSDILKDVPFLIIKTIKIDIYGRYVADVFFDENKNPNVEVQEVANNGVYLNQILLDVGSAEIL